MKRLFQLAWIFSLLLAGTLAFGQFGQRYEGPDDPPADPQFEREGKMTGNRVMVLFKNNTELSEFPRKDVSRWPNTYYGNIMHDGIGLLILSQVYIRDGNVPVHQDTNEVHTVVSQGVTVDTLYYCQTNYREEMDRDPTGTIEWGLHPVYGYLNINSETPALSNDPNSWPPQGWPARGKELKWRGEWDGRFGRGVMYADLECYFAANDAQDQEYRSPSDVASYFPRPDVPRMGDVFPELSVQADMPWGGLGIRVQQRGFQWNNPQARDAIFWEYTIANTTPYNLLQNGFGYWLDNDIGGENAGEDASFNDELDLCYSWDTDGKGEGGYPTGNMGIAYLESPGIATDGADNDDDGITDERRDNKADNQIVGPTFGITDMEKFLTAYGLKESELKTHYAADEDQDWDDGVDANGNGKYEVGEFSGDDVGLDGVGPGELNYFGPDADGSECNHKPDFLEGKGCEPDFAWVDISESDMLGLTAMRLYPIPDHTEPFTNWYRNDESMWDLLTYDSLESGEERIANLAESFCTAKFPLYAGLTERISMSELHAYDDLVGMRSADHIAPVLFNLKKVVQLIYEKDYRFAQPPKMPTLAATPGDGFVMLTWDNIADTRTREPLLNGQNDFEGYKVFRATDKKFSDPEIITDGEGTPMFKKPIFQCDLKDSKTGFTNYGLQSGMGYKLGDDTGITHSFIDNTVQNGRTYYYAVVAYDYGISPDSLRWKVSEQQKAERFGIAPSENNVVIELDDAEDVTFIGKNVAIVTPGPKAPGREATIDTLVNFNNAWGSGRIVPELMSEKAVRNGHTYAVKFTSQRIDSIKNYTHGVRFSTNGLFVYDVTEGINVLVYEDKLTVDPLSFDVNKDPKYMPQSYHTMLASSGDVVANKIVWYLRPNEEMVTDLFDGIRLHVEVPTILAQFSPTKSGWLGEASNSPINILTTRDESAKFPWQYNIVFTSDTLAYTDRLRPLKNMLIRDENGTALKEPDIIKSSLSFYVENTMFVDMFDTTMNERMSLVVHDLNKNGRYDILEDRVIVGAMDDNNRWIGTAFIMDFLNAASEDELPKPNDVYRVDFDRPFHKNDSLTFTINATTVADGDALKGHMDEIKVVPNPYVATNVMETAVANRQLNQRRRLMFTHIPEKCTIKIFSAAGILVDEIHAPEDGLVSFTTTNKQTGDTEDLGLTPNGIIHWDMLSKEGLEIAAGIYVFHVKNELTGEEKIGKFAVIK